MTALKILTDGSKWVVEIAGATISEQNASIRDQIGGFMETLVIAPDAVILVDEDGLYKCLAYNRAASDIAEQDLVGPALIVGLVDLEDGEQAFGDCPRRFLEGVAC